MTRTPDEPVVRDYLLLGLRLGRLVDGFVDCWFGDPALARRVAAEPAPDPAALARDASGLLRALDDSGLAEDRRRFLRAQVRALECSANRLAGAGTTFLDEVEAYFNVEIGLADTGRYAEVHDQIAALLPGPGDLRARLMAHHDRDRLPPELLGPALRALSGGLRDLVGARFGLPADETVEYEVVGDKPWNAFNRYTGGFRSLVTINADAGHGMSALPHLATHECYPGHHTEHCAKEAGLVRAGGHGEQVISLVNTPQCLMAEGTAELALTAVMGEGWGPWTAGILTGIGARMDGGLAERLLPLTARLLAARQDAAILLHDRGTDPDVVVAYLQRWMLVSEERARHMVRFLTDPLWRAYTVTYIEGARLVGAWLAARPAGQSVTERYRRLLDEPLLPATLSADLAAAS
ncbi:DUF885 domain-containing protein [Spirillospora sp. NBC_01491]|uniref:DUF885 domain-containing protein n=1 Tax=Spirillospora sp. NBC_01491 TaxID=2976007 RepID=UPI002E30BA03|nr:DUF885 domain-containing protein [Spirillospora sp. NBC_01491]